MSEIEKYRKALNFRAKAKYLTRDFIVPKYTGTEPDIVPDTNIDPGMVVDPSRILPKNFTDDMPFVTDENNPEQLDLSEGGSVERQEFAPGGEAKKFSRVKTSKFKYPFTGRYGTIYYSKPIDYGKAQSTPQVEKKYKKFQSYFNKAIEKEDYSYLNTSNRGKGKLPHHYSQELNKIKPGTSEFKIFAEKIGLDEKTLKEVLEERKKFVSASKSEAFKRGKLNKINDQKIIYETLEKGPSDVKTLSKKTGLTQTETKEELRKLLQNIYAQRVQIGKGKYAMENKWSLFLPKEENKIDQLLKNFSRTEGIERIQKDTIGDLFYKAYGKQFLPDGKNLNPTHNPAKYNAVLNKLKEYNTIRTALQNEFGINLELDHPLNRAALNNINATPDQLVRVNPITKELNRGIKEKIQTKYDKVIKNIENSKGVELEKLVSEKKGLENLTKYLELETGKISSTGKVLRYGVDPFETLNMKKVILQNLENQNIIAQRIKTPEYAEMVKQAGVEKFKFNVPEIKTKDVTKFIGSIGCPTYAVGGRVNFSEGSDCYNKGLKKLEEGNLSRAELNVARRAITTAGEEGSFLKNILDKAGSGFKFTASTFDDLMAFGRTPGGRLLGYGVGVGLPTYLAKEELLKGNIKEAGRELGYIPTLGFGLPEALVGSYKTDLISHAKEKGFNVESVEKIFNKDEISKKINDVEELLSIGSKNEKFIKNLEDKKKSLYNEYNNIELSELDKNIFDKNFESFSIQNREKLPKFIQDKNKISEDVQKDIAQFKKEKFDPAFVEEEKINIPLIKEEPSTEAPYEFISSEMPSQNFNKGGYIDYVREYRRYMLGGRVKLSEGSKGPKLSRRGFLGFLAGAAATPLAYKAMKGKKLLQGAKIATKVLPEVSGMPEWFNPLVTKIMKDGVDISPKVTKVEDMVKVKRLEVPVPGEKKTDIITMTEYPDGRIEISADVYGGSFDSPFDLVYRPPKSDIDLATGKQIKEPGEFSVIENRPRPVGGPDDADYEIDYEKMTAEDAVSDLERIERIATGKRIPPQKVKKREERRIFVEDNPYDDITNRYGDAGDIEYDRMRDEGLFDEIE